jgi:hypothetical protein
LNKYFVAIQKNIRPILKNWIWPFFRRVFKLIGIFVVLIYLAGKVNWAPMENWFIDKLAHREPTYLQAPPYDDLVVNIPDTKVLKKEKYLIFKSNIKYSFQLLTSKMGFQNKSQNNNLASISKEVSKESKLKDLPVNDMKLEESKEEDKKIVSSDWGIIKKNLNDGIKALKDVFSISIMTEDGKQMIVKVVEDKPVATEYDSSDKVMRWGKEIQTASSKYGIDPALIAAVIEQESGGNPNAKSPAGAIGLMQLIPSTAEELGVNPFDPVQNIEGGTKYLAIQLNRFGNIELALAAYNAGPSRVTNLSYLYISETQNYIQKVPTLAIKYQPQFATAVMQTN